MMGQKPIQNIIIAIAMEAEAKPFIEHLELKLIDGFFPSNVPFVAYGGTHTTTSSSSSSSDATADASANDDPPVTTNVTVIANGKDTIYGTGMDNVGTVPAALATYLALQKLPNTEVLINAGTCGGFQRMGASIGDVYLTTGVANHDRRISIPPFVPYGIGKIDTTTKPTTITGTSSSNSTSSTNSTSTTTNNNGVILHLDLLQEIATRYKYKLGNCTTGNSLDKTDEDDKHMITNNASVKDMEAAAIAWSVGMFYPYTSFVGVKVVTDIVDGTIPTGDEFLSNLHTASVSLQEALPKILDYIIVHYNSPIGV